MNAGSYAINQGNLFGRRQLQHCLHQRQSLHYSIGRSSWRPDPLSPLVEAAITQSISIPALRVDWVPDCVWVRPTRRGTPGWSLTIKAADVLAAAIAGKELDFFTQNAQKVTHQDANQRSKLRPNRAKQDGRNRVLCEAAGEGNVYNVRC